MSVFSIKFSVVRPFDSDIKKKTDSMNIQLHCRILVSGIFFCDKMIAQTKTRTGAWSQVGTEILSDVYPG